MRFSLKAGFERNFGVDVWYPKPTNARMIWQRSRMVYPFLEVAHRAWLNATDMALGQSEPEDCNIIYDDDDEVEAGGESAYVDTFGDLRQALDDYVPLCGDEADEENSAAVCMCMCMCMFHVACGMCHVSCACACACACVMCHVSCAMCHVHVHVHVHVMLACFSSSSRSVTVQSSSGLPSEPSESPSPPVKP